MMTAAEVKRLRKVYERMACERRDAGAFDPWIRHCNLIRGLDIVLGEAEAPGYEDPTERIPWIAHA